MVQRMRRKVPSLEEQCTHAYLAYLYEEIKLISQLKLHEGKSVLLRQFGLQPDRLLAALEEQLSTTLKVREEKTPFFKKSSLSCFPYSGTNLSSICSLYIFFCIYFI